MYTGTLIEELMATVDRAQSSRTQEPQERLFELWNAFSSEPSMNVQASLEGVA